MNDTPPPLDGISILVVEDEAFIAMAIEDILKSEGAGRVVTAHSCQAAMKCLEGAPFDAAILDVRLPDGTTSQVAEKLAKTKTAVVFHSGHAERELLAEFPQASFLGKPAKSSDLVMSIREALS